MLPELKVLIGCEESEPDTRNRGYMKICITYAYMLSLPHLPEILCACPCCLSVGCRLLIGAEGIKVCLVSPKG